MLCSDSSSTIEFLFSIAQIENRDRSITMSSDSESDAIESVHNSGGVEVSDEEVDEEQKTGATTEEKEVTWKDLVIIFRLSF